MEQNPTPRTVVVECYQKRKLKADLFLGSYCFHLDRLPQTTEKRYNRYR
jgi:hypothetical protein